MDTKPHIKRAQKSISEEIKMYYPIPTILQNINKWTPLCAHFGLFLM